jgi:hypothetical protein
MFPRPDGRKQVPITASLVMLYRLPLQNRSQRKLRRVRLKEILRSYTPLVPGALHNIYVVPHQSDFQLETLTVVCKQHQCPRHALVNSIKFIVQRNS